MAEGSGLRRGKEKQHLLPPFCSYCRPCQDSRQPFQLQRAPEMRAGLCKTGTLLTHAPCRSMPLPAALVQAPRGSGWLRGTLSASWGEAAGWTQATSGRLCSSAVRGCGLVWFFTLPLLQRARHKWSVDVAVPQGRGRSGQRLGIGESMGNVCSLGGLGLSCIVLASRKETRGTEQHDSASGAALWLRGRIISWDKSS